VAEIGRNDPCPCGSGKKFKKCCAQAPSVELPEEIRRALSEHHSEPQVLADMLRWARKKYGTGWLSVVEDVYFDDEELDDAELATVESEIAKLDEAEVEDAERTLAELEDASLERREAELQLLVPWAVYHYEKDGKTAAQAFLEDRRSRLAENMKGWLDAQAKAWLSVWEVLEVKAGEGVRIRDLLTAEERFVHESMGSRLLRLRDAVLCRVVDFAGVSTFCGMHPRALPPIEAEAAIHGTRRELEVPSGSIPFEKLRSTDGTLVLIDYWRAAVAQMDEPKPLPELQNTDGDPLLLTKDHFDFGPKDRGRVLKKLQALEGAQQVEHDDGEAEVPFNRPGNEKMKSWESTLIGRAVVGQSRLTLETNSTRRADTLKERVEAGLGDLVRHRLREHSDVEALLKSRPPAEGRAEVPQSPEVQALVRDIKEKHMDQWLDEHIPALDGLTPREAAAKPETRAKLDLLMRDIEHKEARLPEGERYDVSRLRQALGLSP
jgi:hypothetical protein